MIPPRHHSLQVWLLNSYTQRLLKKHFHQIEFHGTLSDQGHSYLVIGNHSSWWDGFWILHLNRKILHRKFHVLMLETELSKRMFFNHCGAYSINPGTRSVLQSLKTSLSLLDDRRNMVLFFPEGEIHSTHGQSKVFQKGVTFLLHQLPLHSAVLQVVMLTDYFSHKKPSLDIYFKEWSGAPEEFETDYNEFYQASIEQQKMMNR